MRIGAFVLSVTVATALVVGAITVVVIRGPVPGPATGLAVFAIAVFVYCPLLLGSLTSSWDLHASLEARRYLRRWTSSVAALELLAAAAVVLYAVLTAVPFWIPLVAIAASALLIAVALFVGRILRRHDDTKPFGSQGWVAISRAEIRRKVVIIAGVFVGTLALGVVALGALFGGTDRSEFGFILAVRFAFLAAAMAGLAVVWPLQRRVRELVSRDVGLLQRLNKIVVRGKRLPLDADEQVAAARYASIVSVTIPFTITNMVVLYSALGLQLLRSPVDDAPGPIQIVLFVVLVLILVIIVPMSIRQIVRARAYAREHPVPVDQE